ncbi:T9SS type A sorting domain-containing protein [Croceibacter atlanticus]|uniref:T9SS type A sorting domain-containing protein n=1 Tax=Croceibacter atlanticus TaxID=313588 RepID=UPI0024BADA42|nr:T9SS type A sorting domain-containing protein [Croceibacter atlanticus]
MRNLYLKFMVIALIIGVTKQTFSQDSEIIYEAIDNGSGVALGVAISSADNGVGTFTGDGVQLAGTARIINQITISCFVTTDTAFIPGEFTVRLYTDCPVTGSSGSEGMCGADGAGSLIEGSEVTINLTSAPTAANPIVIDMPNVDISSETDDTIWVMFNSQRDNINGVLNGIAMTGSDALTEINAFSSCSTASTSSCARRIIGAASNNFVVSISATEILNTATEKLSDAVTLFPNPIYNEATVSFEDIISLNSMKIFDIKGSMVAHKYLYNLENNFKLDLSHLESGIYFMNFESDKGEIVKRFIKK